MASVGFLPAFVTMGGDMTSGYAPATAMTAAPHFPFFQPQGFPQAAGGAPQSKLAQRAAPSRPARGRGGRRARAPVSLPLVLQAVESLYRDGLKPYGRLLRKRMAEAPLDADAREVDDRELRTVCASCPWLQVEDAEGAEWTATLVGRPHHFVDVHSPEDLYPPQLWAGAASYFAAMEGALPGGRYMCARHLFARELPFLAGYSLGQIAHIVQLAISHKKLLGYSEGTLVPYARSQSMLKERHAESQQPCQGPAGACGIADRAALRACLQRTLEEAVAGGQRSVPLSNLKQVFQARFGLELSETALGYAKLSELLQDPCVRDLCEVKLLSMGHVLVPLQRRSRISLAEGLGFEGGYPSVAVQHTPPSADVKALSPPPGAQRRCRPRPLCLDEAASTPTTPTCSDSGAISTPASDEASASSAFLSATPARTPFPPTPSPYAMAGSMRLFSSFAAPALDAVLQEEASQVAEPLEAPARLAEFSDAPAIIATEGGAAESWRTSGIRPLTPSTLDSLGFSVLNTFIHAPLPPPTPMKIASRLRASSLPRTAR